MRKNSLLVLVIVAASVAGCRIGPQEMQPPAGGEGPVTTVSPEPPPELGPTPEEVPADARDVIVLESGPEHLDHTHLRYLESQGGYVEGSARVEAVYPGRDGPEYLLRFQLDQFERDRMTCRAVARPGEEPASSGCGSGGDLEEHGIGGMGYSVGAGPNSIEVEHASDASATVIELMDGSSFVVRPGDSTISFHRWEGEAPARVTVFFEDGTSESRLTLP